MDNPYRWIVFVVCAFGWGGLLAYTTDWNPVLVAVVGLVLGVITSIIDLILAAVVELFDQI